MSLARARAEWSHWQRAVVSGRRAAWSAWLETRRLVARRPGMLTFAPQLVLLHRMIEGLVSLASGGGLGGLGGDVMLLVTWPFVCFSLHGARGFRLGRSVWIDDLPTAIAAFSGPVWLFAAVAGGAGLLLHGLLGFVHADPAGPPWVLLLLFPLAECAVACESTPHPVELASGVLWLTGRHWRTWLVGQWPALALCGLGWAAEQLMTAWRPWGVLTTFGGAIGSVLLLFLPGAVQAGFFAVAFAYRVELVERLERGAR